MPTRRRATSSGPPFTVAFPTELDARKDGDAWWVEVDGRELRLSNLNKVFWTNEGYTKGDLISYYWNVAQLIGPYLDGRPLTMKRMPDGAEGPFFYEKTAPSHAGLDADARSCPRTRRPGRSTTSRSTTRPRCSTWPTSAASRCTRSSRCDDVAHPDYFFFDLDPFEPYTYEDVLTVARHIKVLLDQLGSPRTPRPPAPRVSRSRPGEARGLHVRPGPRVRRRLRTDDREGRPTVEVTMAWRVADRAGKVFIDHNMNRQARTSRPPTRCVPRHGRPSPRRSHGTRSPRAASSRRTSGSTTSGSDSIASATCSRAS